MFVSCLWRGVQILVCISMYVVSAQIKNIYYGHIRHKSKSCCLETKSIDHPWIIQQYWIQFLRQSDCLQSRSLLVVALNILNGKLHSHIKNARDGWDLQFHFCFTMDFDTYMYGQCLCPIDMKHPILS